MLETVKNVMSSIGDNTGDFARRFGPAALDVAKQIGPTSAVLAKRVSKDTRKIARRVGPVRGLLGIALVGAAVGGSIYLVRYLRDRKNELEGMAPEGEQQASEQPTKGKKRNKRKASNGHAPAAQ